MLMGLELALFLISSRLEGFGYTYCEYFREIAVEARDAIDEQI